MDTHLKAGAAAAPAAHPVETTRTLLALGGLAGPLYLVVGLAQALLRDGFDLMRHPLSLLANGPGGWIQTLNFVLAGAMVVGAAVAVGRSLGPKSRGVSWSLALFGLGMLAAALFPADPVDGFPPGTPEGFPATISRTGMLHFVAGTIGFTALGVSALFAGSALARRNATSLARWSYFSGVAVLLGFFGGFALAGVLPGTAGIWFAVVVGWAWLSVLSVYLRRSVA